MATDNTNKNYDYKPDENDLGSQTNNKTKSEVRNEKLFNDLIEQMDKMNRNYARSMNELTKLVDAIHKKISECCVTGGGNNRPEMSESRGGGGGSGGSAPELSESSSGRGGRGGSRWNPAGNPEGRIQILADIIRRTTGGATTLVQNLGKQIETLFSPPKDLQYKSFSEYFDMTKTIGEINQTDINLKRIIYQTTGLGIEAKDVMKSFMDISKHSNIIARSGRDAVTLYKQLGKYQQSGVKMDDHLLKSKDKMLKVSATQLNTEKQLGLQAGTLNDYFVDLINHSGKSSTEIALMGKNMRDVAHSTGLTGQKMLEALNASKQFTNNLMNTGNLTAQSMKNVTSMTASFKKFGVENAGGEMMGYLTDSSKLFLGANDEMAQIVRQAAAIGGVANELLDGTITKSDKTMRSFTQGFDKLLESQFGVTTIEQFEALDDGVKAMLNRQAAAITGGKKTLGELLRMKQAAEESSMTFAEKMLKIDKQRIKNQSEGTAAEKKMNDKVLRNQQEQLMRSKSFDILGDISLAIQKSGAKTTKEMFGEYDVSKHAKDLSIMGLGSPEKITAAGGKQVAQQLITDSARQLELDLMKQGKTQKQAREIIGFTPEDIKKTFAAGTSSKEFKENYEAIFQKLIEAEQTLNEETQENLDPSTKALKRIQTDVSRLTVALLGELQDQKMGVGDEEGKLGQFIEGYADFMEGIGIEGLIPGGQTYDVARPGILDRAALLDLILGDTSFARRGEEELARNEDYTTRRDDLRTSGAYSIFEQLDKMLGGLLGTTTPSNTPGQDIGTNLVTSNGLAYLHKGERIIPQKFANSVGTSGPYMPEKTEMRRPVMSAKQDSPFSMFSKIFDFSGVKALGSAWVDMVNQGKKLLGFESPDKKANRSFSHLEMPSMADQRLMEIYNEMYKNVQKYKQKHMLGTKTMEYRYGRDNIGGGPRTMEYRYGRDDVDNNIQKMINKSFGRQDKSPVRKPGEFLEMTPKYDKERNIVGWDYKRLNAKGEYIDSKGEYNNIPEVGNNNLMPNSERIQTQMSGVGEKISNFEEKNSEVIVNILTQIRDAIKKGNSQGSGSNGNGVVPFFERSDDYQEDYRNPKVDSRMGRVKGGDYSINDSIKAYKY